MPKLKRDILEPNRYEYMDVEDSILYDKVKSLNDKQSKAIKRLLLRNRLNCQNEHEAYRY